MTADPLRDRPSAERLHAAADDSEETGEELMRRAEAMLSLGRRLLAQAGDLRGTAEGATAPAQGDADAGDRSVGRKGAVGLGEAIDMAKQMGTFTRGEFQEATGLGAGAASKWLARLIQSKPPILELAAGGRGRPHLYTYLPIGSGSPRDRPEHARAVERAAGVGADAPERGVQAAHTRTVGRSGKPGRDKRRARAGVRVRSSRKK